ncbi:hypothetical protein DDF62_20635 [Caulobacter radicis]|nr:hypothetical protein DDF62_20635 [Caulobacter radicis]
MGNRCRVTKVATQFVLAGAAALILTGSASLAHAQTKTRTAPATADFTVKNDFTASQGAPFSPQNPKKTLEFDARKGKWGLKLDLDQPVGREMELKDVQAGAYYKVTPSIRVGGAVALGENNPVAAARKNETREPAPRVKLETAFKF